MAATEAGGPARAWPAVAALAFNAFVWGVSWWPLRELQALGLHPLWTTAGVYLLALACLLAVHPGAWRALARLPGLWLLAAAAGATNVGFNWAVTVGDVVRVVLLFYLMPAWSVLFAWALLGERPTPAGLARVALGLAGVVVVLKTPEAPWPWPQDAADWLALAGGASFALTNILLRRLRETPAPARILAMFGGGALTAVAVALLGLAQGAIAAPAPLGAPGLLLGVLLALGFLAGNIALQYGAARLAAQTTALVMLLEVVVASASSVIAGAAAPGWRTWAGGALILAAAVWSALPDRRTMRR